MQTDYPCPAISPDLTPTTAYLWVVQKGRVYRDLMPGNIVNTELNIIRVLHSLSIAACGVYNAYQLAAYSVQLVLFLITCCLVLLDMLAL